MTSLSHSQLADLSRLVAATMGLNYPPAHWADLEQQTLSAAKDFGFADLATFVPWLLAAPLTRRQIEALASHLTISETYFWREPQMFEALRHQILPDLIAKRAAHGRRLRIWCAGCSTGEEAYSIAILLRELIPDLPDWHITLLATDINPHQLRRAALGVFDEWSFRGAPSRFKERYFHRRHDGLFEILPELRHRVTFASLNLAEDDDGWPANSTQAMDVIFCRNVLMYFVRERAQQVRQRFYQSLVEGGWLIVGASELSQTNYPQFVSVRFPGAFAYCREAALPHAPEAVQPATAAASLTAGPAPDLPSQTAVSADGGAAQPDLALRVRQLADQGQLRQALIVCEQAIATARLQPQLHYLHAVILQEQKLDEAAKAALRRALYLDPKFVLAYFALGNLERRQGQTLAAQKSFRNALALLSGFSPDDLLPGADGLTAGRLRDVMRTALQLGDVTR